MEQTSFSVHSILKWPWDVKENKLASLTQVSQLLASADEKNGNTILLEKILEAALSLLKARRGFILLKDPETELLSIKVAKGMPPSVIPQVSLRIGEGVSGFVVQKGMPILIDDLRTYRGFRKTPASRYESEAFFRVPIISAPLNVFGRTLGVLNISDAMQGGSFTTEDLALLSVLATESSFVLAYWQLLEREKQIVSSAFPERAGLINRLFNEIQNPMTTIQGHAQYLLMSLPQECKAAEVLKTIMNQASHAVSAVKKLCQMIKEVRHE